MKIYIISEEELNEVIEKITDNIDTKSRKTGRMLSDISESVRQAIKFNIKKKAVVVDSGKEEIVVKPCPAMINHDYRGSF